MKMVTKENFPKSFQQEMCTNFYYKVFPTTSTQKHEDKSGTNRGLNYYTVLTKSKLIVIFRVVT